MIRSLTSLLVVAGCCPGVPDVEPAGADFAVQGEYLTSDLSLAAQVVATGDGQFDVMILGGGFPGAGWDGRLQTASGTVEKLAGDGYTLRAAAGALVGTGPLGEAVMLERVERQSPTLGAPPPVESVVLFDGRDVAEWERARLDGDLVADGAGCEIGAGAITLRRYTDFTLHLEFQVPFMPGERAQDRGNSGVFLQDRYELQVLDSFGRRLNETEPIGDVCGEIYRQSPVLVNASLPPLSWQTYDIDFTAARYDANKRKITNAVVSVRHNGVVIHDQTQIQKDTSDNSGRSEGPDPGPLMLQDHNAPVLYRNIWVVER